MQRFANEAERKEESFCTQLIEREREREREIGRKSGGSHHAE